jgi:hypothetical protein
MQRACQRFEVDFLRPGAHAAIHQNPDWFHEHPGQRFVSGGSAAEVDRSSARSGSIDLSSKAEFASTLRPDTPKEIRLMACRVGDFQSFLIPFPEMPLKPMEVLGDGGAIHLEMSRNRVNGALGR